jgi:hypothetical protein
VLQPLLLYQPAVLSPPQFPVRYGITDVPPWWLCIVLGFQTYLTMLGATVLIPILLVPAMGGDTEGAPPSGEAAPDPPRAARSPPLAHLLPSGADLAKTICTCFFASGINTLLQTLLGTRLPIVQVRHACHAPRALRTAPSGLHPTYVARREGALRTSVPC